MKRTASYYICLTLLVGMSACSTTRNIPEDEKLYRGIAELCYDKPSTTEPQTQEGVITALAGAYNTVEGLLSGDAQARRRISSLNEKELKDSIKKANQQDKEAYNNARTEVESVLEYAPNGSLMGSSYATHPLPVRLWLYNQYVNSTSKFGQWVFNHFATTPVFTSTVNPRMRTIVAQNTLKNFGYFRGQVSFDTISMRNPKKERISYYVDPGELFHLDSIAYIHFPTELDSIIQAQQWASELKKGEPFSVLKLDKERSRLTKHLRDNGYYYYRNDYITYRADTLQVPEKVQLQVTPSPTAPMLALKKYYLGETRVNLYKQDNYVLKDSVTRRSFTFAHNGDEKKPALRLGALLPFILHRNGDLYKQSVQELTQEKIASMGIFSSVRINYEPRDTTAANDTLDVTISAVLDKPYDTEFQGKVTAKSNGQVGPGVSFSMSKYNAFRAAETLTFQAWGSYEWQTGADLHGDRSLINSYEYGINTTLTYPRIMLYKIGSWLNRKRVSSTSYMIHARWLNRANYFGRVTIGAGMNFTLQKGRNIKHEFSPLKVDYDLLLNRTATFDSIVSANPALYVSMRNQFIPSMEYNFSWQSTRHHQRTLKVNVKEAGNVTSLIYAMAGNALTKSGKELLGVPFAQYIKASSQYTHLFPVTRKSRLATRVFLGAIYSFGNSKSAPYSDLFSIGGANSIRAFSIRSFGPGAYHPATSNYSYIDQMGDLKFEANIEYRFPLVANLYGATFLDAGNVWLIRENEHQPNGELKWNRLGKDIALGTGFGLRYDLDLLVLRVDVGIGIHAPYATGKSGYYNMPKFSKSLGYHLAVGYPF